MCMWSLSGEYTICYCFSAQNGRKYCVISFVENNINKNVYLCNDVETYAYIAQWSSHTIWQRFQSYEQFFFLDILSVERNRGKGDRVLSITRIHSVRWSKMFSREIRGWTIPRREMPQSVIRIWHHTEACLYFFLLILTQLTLYFVSVFLNLTGYLGDFRKCMHYQLWFFGRNC